jgi:hypothetical protein
MGSVYKLVLFFVILGFMIIAGFRAFQYVNSKIMDTKTAWELLGYTILLILINGGLFFGGLWVLIKTYDFLSTAS